MKLITDEDFDYLMIHLVQFYGWTTNDLIAWRKDFEQDRLATSRCLSALAQASLNGRTFLIKEDWK
jgi:hypothetical protein